jgi:GxxExxY protein
MLVRPSDLVHDVIGCAIEVHRIIGPGLFESVYQACLARELTLRRIPFVSQVAVPVNYKGSLVGCAYRVDLVIADRLVVELKAVENLLPVHDAQVVTYMKLLHIEEGLILNFNVPLMKQGIRRLLLPKSKHVGA